LTLAFRAVRLLFLEQLDLRFQGSTISAVFRAVRFRAAQFLSSGQPTSVLRAAQPLLFSWILASGHLHFCLQDSRPLFSGQHSLFCIQGFSLQGSSTSVFRVAALCSQGSTTSSVFRTDCFMVAQLLSSGQATPTFRTVSNSGVRTARPLF